MFLYFTLLISNEHFLQGNPIIFLEKIEDKKNGRRSITVMIESLPAPYLVQWSAKNKDDEHYTPIDINTEEYEGTTVSFPHPVLVVRQKDQLEKKCFKIEVTNFIGKTVHEISGKKAKRMFICYFKKFDNVFPIHIQSIAMQDDYYISRNVS